MKRFRCTVCGQIWYSAATTDEPCADCGGELVETVLEPSELER